MAKKKKIKVNVVYNIPEKLKSQYEIQAHLNGAQTKRKANSESKVKWRKTKLWISMRNNESCRVKRKLNGKERGKPTWNAFPWRSLYSPPSWCACTFYWCFFFFLWESRSIKCFSIFLDTKWPMPKHTWRMRNMEIPLAHTTVSLSLTSNKIVTCTSQIQMGFTIRLDCTSKLVVYFLMACSLFTNWRQ